MKAAALVAVVMSVAVSVGCDSRPMSPLQDGGRDAPGLVRGTGGTAVSSVDAASDSGGGMGGSSASPDAALDVTPGAGGIPGAGGMPGTLPSCRQEGRLYASDRRFIEVFAATTGTIIVQDDAILLFGHDGQLQQKVSSPRPITAAGFDGQMLAVADSAILTSYSPALIETGEVLLTQSCASVAVMSGGPAVCYAAGAATATFYSYDVPAAKLVNHSTMDGAFGGDRMMPVPGTRDFVTWENDLYLYQLGADGAVQFVDGSPNDNATPGTSFIGNQVFAFSTPQATDLINWEGRLFRNRGDDCTPVSPYLEKSRCFTPDGELGTLPALGGGGNAHYIALGNGAPGEIVGLVSELADIAMYPYMTLPCGPAGCLLQRIDYGSRTVTAQRRLDSFMPKTVLALREDATCQTAVLAYQVPGALAATASEWTGFQVDVVGFAPPFGGAGGGAGTGGGAGGRGGGGGIGTGGAPSTGCAPVGLLDTGTSPLVNAFVVPTGVIVVRSNSIALLGRDRSVKAMLSPPAAISTAAFDGQTLATSDTANVNVYSSALVPQGTIPLRDACFDSILAPGGVFVCEPDRQHSQIFTAFDVRAVRFLKEVAQGFGAGGAKMALAPGTPYFAVHTGGSPAMFSLYAVDPDGTVRGLGAAQAGDTLNNAFGFAGAPASHLLLPRGDLLRLLGPMCAATAAATQSGCLQPDGVLGTLQPTDRFVALDSDSAGTVIGLVSHSGSADAFEDAPCLAGCALQRLDVSARAIAAQREHVLDARQVLFLRHDPTCQMAVVGYQSPATSSNPITFPYRVDLLDYLP